MASIYSITYQPTNKKYEERGDKFLRVSVYEIQLIENHGIEGDAKAGHNPNRQLNLLSQEWVQSLSDEGFKTSPGQFGEQMTLTGLEVTELPSGSRIQLGPEAVIEITKNRTGCVRLETVQDKKLEEIGGPIGALAKVLVSGTIRVGDEVKLLQTA
ncbi:MAG: MOSC domain-containing protein [Chloroflexi bacterium]|nr:MAG: MOSC domain-containing protein [Chloroflexota bacterium]MBL1196797.1 MOSC domain-containing protein [Chloroflexota bacterium]NOH14091.1 MOSC domain-containing protein [Chloroflexota bacterium]